MLRNRLFNCGTDQVQNLQGRPEDQRSREELMLEPSVQRLSEVEFLLLWAPQYFLLQCSTDWIRPALIAEDNLIY